MLEGDFVHIVHPAFPPTRQEKERLLHISVAGAVDFRVPCLPHFSESVSPSATSPKHRDVSGKKNSAGLPGWKNHSLGDIVSRALELRRQFMARSETTTRRHGSGVRLRLRDDGIKIKLPVFVSREAKRATSKMAVQGNVSAATGAVVLNPKAKRVSEWREKLFPSKSSRSASVQTPPSAHTTTPEFSARVVEQAERGGASFVAFADGRARGMFANRTIVTLGAPSASPAFRGKETGVRPSNYEIEMGQGGGNRLSTGERVGNQDVVVFPEKKDDRDVECILPDGNVLRFKYRSIASLGCFGVRSIEKSSGGSGSPPYSDSGICFGRVAAKSWSASVENSNIRPYVISVQRFALWASADPAGRRAMAQREEAARLGAAAEAERNRRFIALHNLVRPPPESSTSTFSSALEAKTLASLHNSSSPSQGSKVVPTDRRAGASIEQEENKENIVFGGGQSLSGRVWGPKGACERNKLVTRLLKANREALLGREACDGLREGLF